MILDFMWFCNPQYCSVSHCQSSVHFYWSVVHFINHCTQIFKIAHSLFPTSSPRKFQFTVTRRYLAPTGVQTPRPSIPQLAWVTSVFAFSTELTSIVDNRRLSIAESRMRGASNYTFGVYPRVQPSSGDCPEFFFFQRVEIVFFYFLASGETGGAGGRACCLLDLAMLRHSFCFLPQSSIIALQLTRSTPSVL